MATKGILWALIFFLTALIMIAIPTKLAVTYYAYLATFELEGEPVYTFAMFMVFLYIVSLIVALIYIVAGLRAIVQRNSDDMGISKGIYWFGTAVSAFIVTFMVLWYIFTGDIAFFSLTAPA